MIAMNNSTIFTADRNTHLKIVVVALVASIGVMVVGIAARSPSVDGSLQASGPVVKAGKPMAITHSGNSVIR
jgi:hypothetical protein